MFSVSTTEAFTKWRFLLDGSAVGEPMLVSAGAHNLSFAVPSGAHAATLQKDTECLRCGPSLHTPPLIPVSGKAAVFLGLTLSGNGTSNCSASLPERKTRRMEIVGDSISCGFGNSVANTMAQHAECTATSAEAWVIDRPPRFLVEASSAYGAYSAQLARRFGAELHLECISGIGVMKNGVSLGAHDAHNMSLYVDRTLPFDESAAGWPYSTWVPELLVVNLGVAPCMHLHRCCTSAA